MVGLIKFRVRNYLTRFVGCLAITLFSATLSAADVEFLVTSSSSHAKQSSREKSMHKNLPDFGEVTTTLYRGGQPSKEGFHTLAKMGINIVVDLRGSRKSERKIVTHLGMRYVAMPWECSFPKDKTFAQFLRLIQENPGKKIFVHCRVGDDRTGMMIASFRMAREGWSAERAEKEMEKFGFDFAHRRMICPRLSSYEEHFPEHFKTSPEFRDLR
jgi:tyrosine-protein phosphatase SIW14